MAHKWLTHSPGPSLRPWEGDSSCLPLSQHQSSFSPSQVSSLVWCCCFQPQKPWVSSQTPRKCPDLMLQPLVCQIWLSPFPGSLLSSFGVANYSHQLAKSSSRSAISFHHPELDYSPYKPTAWCVQHPTSLCQPAICYRHRNEFEQLNVILFKPAQVPEILLI